jgi:hypothetical protein
MAMFDLIKNVTDLPKSKDGLIMLPEINIDGDFEEWIRLLVEEARDKSYVDKNSGPIVRPLSLTPDFAAALLRYNDTNRRPARGTVEKYVKRMKRGEWERTMECITIDLNGMVQDGGHRLTACVKSGITIPVHIAFGSSPRVFDVIGQGKTRDAGDILQIHGVANSRKVAELCRLIYMYDKRLRVFNTARDLSHRDIASYVETHNQKMQDSLVMQRLAAREKLPRANVYAAAHYCITATVDDLGTWMTDNKYTPDQIEMFIGTRKEAVENWFLNLIRGIVHSKNETSWYLRRKMFADAINNHAYGPPRTEAVFNFLVKGWNAYACSDKPLKKYHYVHGDGITRITPPNKWTNLSTSRQLAQLVEELIEDDPNPAS